jgi:methylmalonyl-CoA mutase
MENLFSEFKPSTAASWKAQLEKDLKGVPLTELVWHNDNGIDIDPFYTSENSSTAYQPTFNHASWRMATRAMQGNDKEVNAYLLSTLYSGADEICVDLTRHAIADVLKDIRLDYISTTFIASAKNAGDIESYLNANYAGQTLDLRILPTGISSSQYLQDYLNAFTNLANTGVSVWGADVLPFHNKNCTAVTELALVLSQMAEYAQVGGKSLQQSPTLRMGVSADYFVQMAKLRAARRLWEIIKQEFNSSAVPYVIAETSLNNKTLSDRYNNLLRSTVEAMAAVAGGCNALVVHDFDVLFGKDTALSRRMAINQQHILKEESYFDKVADIACGSYYIEHLTDALATKALELFKTIEKEGGYFACRSNGKIEALLKADAEHAAAAFAAGKQISIGVNKFKNEKEKVELHQEARTFISSLALGNPALEFELQHFYSTTHA